MSTMLQRRRRVLDRVDRRAREAGRRDKLAEWRALAEGKLEKLSIERLSAACNEKGYALLSEATEEELRTACREAGMPIFVDEVEEELPDHPVTRLAATLAFCDDPFAFPDLLKRLREEFKCLGAYSAPAAQLLLSAGT